MKKFLCLSLASVSLLGCTAFATVEKPSDMVTISYRGQIVSIPVDEVALYFDAGNDLFNGSQGVGDNRDWLAMNGSDYTIAEKFVTMLDSID